MQRQDIIEILSNGKDRPLSVPQPIARIEHTINLLTQQADKLERIGKANPEFIATLNVYRIVQGIREEILTLADTALLLNEFYSLKEQDWLAFNAEYIAKGE